MTIRLSQVVEIKLAHRVFARTEAGLMHQEQHADRVASQLEARSAKPHGGEQGE